MSWSLTTGPAMLLRATGCDDREWFLPHEAGSLVIGRGAEADLVLAGDRSVSRAHAILRRTAEGWQVLGTGLSRNGAFVNDRRVLDRRALQDGDRLRLGRTELECVLHDGPTVQITELERKVLIALLAPLDHAGHGVPATNTEIALTTGLDLEHVTVIIWDLCRRLGVTKPTATLKRAHLAQIAQNHGGLP